MSFLHVASSSAGVASTERGAWQRNRIDSVAGDCGLCPPALIRKSGTMAARRDHPLPRHKRTTPTPSRPDCSRRPAAGYGWGFDKPSGKMVHPGKTTATLIASRPLAERGRIRMAVAPPSRAMNRVASHRHHIAHRARTGPSARSTEAPTTADSMYTCALGSATDDGARCRSGVTASAVADFVDRRGTGSSTAPIVPAEIIHAAVCSISLAQIGRAQQDFVGARPIRDVSRSNGSRRSWTHMGHEAPVKTLDAPVSNVFRARKVFELMEAPVSNHSLIGDPRGSRINFAGSRSTPNVFLSKVSPAALGPDLRLRPLHLDGERPQPVLARGAVAGLGGLLQRLGGIAQRPRAPTASALPLRRWA